MKQIKNIPISVKEKLKNISTTSGKDFNKVLRQYIQERFLYRLSKSAFSENLILKGALLFLAYNISRSRPTRDIDFLGNKISNNAKDIKSIIKTITVIDCEDGLKFDQNNIEVENIVEEGDYHGVRVKINAKLGTIKDRIQIDIGFGDKITNGPIEIEYPTMLDMPIPKLKVYSLETAIAEKFEAIVSLQLQTSRMKDFYDIYFIASKNEFDLLKLSQAIKITFENRSTNIEDSKYIFEEKFKEDKIKIEQWKSFIDRSELKDEIGFSSVVDIIKKFIEPACNVNSKSKTWNPPKAIWN
ncbi:MAG: nucleotidyl transferase AbiEii/AbiGii toxin family protein [Ignavibacteriae bacterium]|nr:nucleotidyl transferase AbiEii/AbiGii toxin family protein [Ignavibacteriota bacterium]